MLALPLLWIAGLSISGCVVIHGNEITARDLAASVPGFTGVTNPDAALAPAPKPGLRRAISQALLSDWLYKSGPGIREFQGSGLQKSTIQEDRVPEDRKLPSSLCVERERMVLTKQIVEQSIRESLAYRDFVLVVEKFSQDLLPPGRLSFPLNGATRPSSIHPDAPFLWRGSWLEESTSSTQQASIPVWAIVRAYRLSAEVHLKVSLPAGSLLNVAQMETFPGVRSAFDQSPDETPQRYAGLILKRFCASGSALSERITESVPVIRKDSVVPIEVVSGGLHLKLTARAETDGWSGQVIPFVIPAGHRRFLAQVLPQGCALLALGTDSGVGRELAARALPGEAARGEKGIL